MLPNGSHLQRSGSSYCSTAVASALTLSHANCWALSDLVFMVLTNCITERFRDPINRSMIQFAPTGRPVPFPSSGPSFDVLALLELA